MKSLFKKGEKTFENIRPVSTLSLFSKIYARGLFRAQSNIFDGAFLRK